MHNLGLNPTSWLTINAGPNFGFSGEERDFEISAYVEQKSI